METSPIETLLAKLAASADVTKVVEATGIPPHEMLKLLTGPDGRRQLRALRALARLHRRLLADQYSPFALNRLAALLGDEKAEVRLKGALAILESLREELKEVKAAKQPAAEKATIQLPALEGTHTAELLEAVAEVLEKRKAMAGD